MKEKDIIDMICSMHKKEDGSSESLATVPICRLANAISQYVIKARIEARIEENKIMHDNIAGCSEEFSIFIHERLEKLKTEQWEAFGRPTSGGG